MDVNYDLDIIMKNESDKSENDDYIVEAYYDNNKSLNNMTVKKSVISRIVSNKQTGSYLVDSKSIKSFINIMERSKDLNNDRKSIISSITKFMEESERNNGKKKKRLKKGLKNQEADF